MVTCIEPVFDDAIFVVYRPQSWINVPPHLSSDKEPVPLLYSQLELTQ